MSKSTLRIEDKQAHRNKYAAHPEYDIGLLQQYGRMPFVLKKKSLSKNEKLQ